MIELYKHLTLDDIRKKIAKSYDGAEDSFSTKRKLLIHKSYCCYKNLGCIFFALNGSPPKGYAIYVPDHKYIIFVNAFGKTRIMHDVTIDNSIIENLRDIDCLPEVIE